MAEDGVSDSYSLIKKGDLTEEEAMGIVAILSWDADAEEWVTARKLAEGYCHPMSEYAATSTRSSLAPCK